MIFENNKFSDWDVISYSSELDYHTFDSMTTAIILKNDDYYYLYEHTHKIEDLSKMPNYIIDDWVKYNKKNLTIKILDENIKEFSEIGVVDADDIANQLISIKRDLILNGIIY